MKIIFSSGDCSETRLCYAKQLGADGVSVNTGTLSGYAETGHATLEMLANLKTTIESHGLSFLTLRIGNSDIHGVLYNTPEKDREIDNICRTIRAAGEAEISFVYYNLTPWRSLDTAWPDTPSAPELRSDDLRHGSGPGRYYRPDGRGDATLLTHTTSRVQEDVGRTPEAEVAPYGQISADEMWERTAYLYERIVPVAEEAGVNIGAHPNDPPEPVYRGVEQNLNTVDGLKRLVDLVPSPRNGLLLCLGTLHEMGDDTMAAIEYFLQHKKIFHIHFRNPAGTLPNGYYQEDFLDEGDLDMLEVMRLLKKYDYQGFIDPDHAIGIAGDEGGKIGFAWELGYIKALRDVVLKE